jgi:hypothetical protein
MMWAIAPICVHAWDVRSVTGPAHPMLVVMSFDVQAPGLVPVRTAPQPAQLAALTQRDMAAAARLGVQAVPVRVLDPVTGPAKRERSADAANDRKAAADRDRLEMLRFAALRRDAAAITAR